MSSHQIISPVVLGLRRLSSIRCVSSKSLQLPWIKSHNPEFKHPGFFVSTKVQASGVCDGHGRFTNEFIPRNTEIARIPLAYAKDIKASNMDITGDMCFIIENKRELEYLIDRYSNEANASQEVVKLGLGDFMGSTCNGLCNFFSNSLCLNHMPCRECNSATYVDFSCNTNGKSAALRSLRDINVGEELFLDYQIFVFPQWYMDWCTDQQITNVRKWLNELHKEKNGSAERFVNWCKQSDL